MKKHKLLPKTFNPKTLTRAVTLGLVMTVGANAYAESTGNVRSSTDGTSYQNIGDLEIYQAARGGSASLMMMLDISGSMSYNLTGRHDTDTNGVNACGAQTYKLERYNLTDSSGQKINSISTFYGGTDDVSDGIYGLMTYCADGQRNRISELKHAMASLLSDGTKLKEDYKIGMGTFPAIANHWGGRIYVPARKLTPEHRYRLIKEILGLNLVGSTPMMSAYADAAAYLLGTTTSYSTSSTIGTAYVQKKQIEYNSGIWNIIPCSGYSGMTLGKSYPNWFSCGATGNKAAYQTVPSNAVSEGFNWVTDSSKYYTPLRDDAFNKLKMTQVGNVDVIGYMAKSGYVTESLDKGEIPASLTSVRLAEKMAERNIGSYAFQDTGFVNGSTLGISIGEKIEYTPMSSVLGTYEAGIQVATTDAKNAARTAYEGVIDNSVCDGYGIYLLTDGQPNGSGAAPGFMLNSLNKTSSGGGGTDRNTLLALAKQGNSGHTQLDDTGSAYASEKQWSMGGDYATILRTNALGLGAPIKTAGVGFANVFAGTTDKKTVTLSDGTTTEVVDCESYTKYNSTKVDAKNFCLMTQKGYGYGEGGFLATSDADEIGTSVKNFIQSLNQSISTAPAGTISVPSDPLSVSNIQPYAYLPMIEPKVDSDPTVWRGNLKKYHTLNGTLYGDNNKRLYVKSSNATSDNADYPSQFNPEATDIWQTTAATTDNSAIDVGGSKEYLQQQTDANTRSVYVEDFSGFSRESYYGTSGYGVYMRKYFSTNTPKLVKISLTNGVLSGLDDLGSMYVVDDKIAIVNYLGVKLSKSSSGLTDSSSNSNIVAATKTAYDANSKNDKPILGGVVHSVPVLASYKGEFNSDGRIESSESKRDDTLLYGSMDGALHMVSAKDGSERMGFIPRAIFDDSAQRHALTLGSTNGKTGEPVFGVDAPWTTYAEYIYQFSDSSGAAADPATVTAKKMYAYGGLRMGGNGIYGLNLTKMRSSNSEDDRVPEIMFSINRYTPGFSRLGQTWSKPLVAKIKTGTGSSSSNFTNVVIFGGGYDMCYEHPNFQVGSTTATHSLTSVTTITQQSKQFSQYEDIQSDNQCTRTAARGNGVYMVNATTGQLLAAWTGEQVGLEDMKDSIVGEITALDRNNNGAIDHLYFADLGGKVWRVDLKEGVQTSAGTADANGNLTPTQGSITRRVVKVLDANGGNSSGMPFRFYEAPIVSFYDSNNKTFAVVNISSGDRSSPLHTKRPTSTTANRIFGFFDRDLASTKLDRAATDPGLITKDLTVSDLMYIKPAEVQAATNDEILSNYFGVLKATVASSTKTSKEGWYYDMNRFDGYTNVPNLKSIGQGMVTGSVYYANIYSPDYEYTQANTCSARVSGGTERQLYCLPWGVCANETTGEKTTVNGVLGYLKAGPGIQELALGTVTNTKGTSTVFRTLLGQQSLSEIAADSTSSTQKATGTTGGDTSAFGFAGVTADAGSNNGGDVYGSNIITSPQYTLAVQRWYDLQNENQSN